MNSRVTLSYDFALKVIVTTRDADSVQTEERYADTYQCERSGSRAPLLNKEGCSRELLHFITMPKVTYSYGGQTKVVEAETGKTILQIALDHGIPMEHACGGNGFCTTCMCKVIQGQEFVSPPNEKETNMGVEVPTHRLGCQTVVSGDITVELEGY